MGRHSVLAGMVIALLLTAWGALPAAGQPAPVGCRRTPATIITVTRPLGPPIAAYPGFQTLGILANGLSAFMPEQMEVTIVTNLAGVEGLNRTTVRSVIVGDRTTYTIPQWLLRAYGGDTARIIADVEGGRLSDVGPCP